MKKLPYGAVTAIARTVGVSYAQVRRWIAKGKPKTTKMDPQKARDLDALIKAYQRQNS